jgi:hypothetical protein
MSGDIPVVVTAAGAQPTPPAALLAALIAAVADVTPGYTATLPASLIEDVSSTQVGGLAVCDSARVETINSISPYGANAFMLLQLGQIYIGPGAAPGVPTNTSTFVTFLAVDANANPLPGQVLAVGFTVSDGTYQYVVQDGGVTGADGLSLPLFCLATVAGSWAVPTNTVTQLVTQVPSNVILTCTNQEPGLSGAAAETEEQYRARVLQAGQAICQGAPTMLKTQLSNVPGVQPRLVSVVQQPGGGWEIICGGGDPYQVGYAIYRGLFDVSTLVGSTLAVTAITQAANAHITTAINHGYVVGQAAQLAGVVGMTPLNAVPFNVVTVIDEKNFTIDVDSAGYPAYVSGGVLTPNLRNVNVSINDAPDIYSIPFVNPPLQTVTVAATWNTIATDFVSQAAVSQLAVPAIVAYLNSITVGAPISLLVMRTVFLEAVASVLAPGLVSTLAFSVSINGVATAPTGDLVIGDPESYVSATAAGVTVNQS